MSLFECRWIQLPSGARDRVEVALEPERWLIYAKLADWAGAIGVTTADDVPARDTPLLLPGTRLKLPGEGRALSFCSWADKTVDLIVIPTAGKEGADLLALSGPGGGGSVQDIGCRVTHSVAQSIPSGSWIALDFDTERWDTDEMHSISVNNSRITCKTAGSFLLHGQASFAASALGVRFVAIRLNNLTYLSYEGILVLSASGITKESTTVWKMSIGDWVEFVVYQNTGSPLNVNAGEAYSPEFMAQLIAPA